jgi:acetyl esterase/lipase
MRRLFIIAIVCLFSNSIFSQEIRTYKETKDEVKLYLSVHKPFRAAKKNPALVFFHGGGYSGGSPVKFARHTEYFVSRGLTVVNVNYRIRKVHNSTPMQSVSDGKAAIRYIRMHARELGINPNKIIAAGGSAGGHLASACALLEGFEEGNNNLEVSCVPNALVLYNPVFKIETKENGGYKGELVKLFPDHSFSPWHNIKKGAPPTVVFLGTQDKHIPVKTAEDYKQKMDSVGSRCDLFIYEEQKHGFFNYREDREAPYFIETVYETDKFLESLGYLKGAPTIATFEFGELIDPIPQATEAYNKVEALALEKKQPSEDKPNVLFIAIDDLRTELNCYGASHIQSPNIDRLASEGVKFTNAHVQQAVCMASRASIMSGIRPEHKGVFSSEPIDLLMPDVLTMNKFFKQNGYNISAFGKIYHYDTDRKIQWGNDYTKPNKTWTGKGWVTQEAIDKIPLNLTYNRGPAYEHADVHDTIYEDGINALNAVRKLEVLAKDDRYNYVEWVKLNTGEVLAKELYDHVKDPMETRNVISHEEYKEVVEKMAVICTQHKESTDHKYNKPKEVKNLF